jgi:hypothetical protein
MRRTLETLVPRWDRRERHNKWIDADPDTVWNALRSLTAREVPVTRLLFRVRAGFGGAAPNPSLPLVEALPFQRMADRRPSELTVGTVVRSSVRRSRTEVTAPLDLDSFIVFAEPGWTKAAMDFTLEPERDGTRLRTETRVVSADDNARRSFALYWLMIRAGSGLIRRDLLRGVDRKARAAKRESY